MRTLLILLITLLIPTSSFASITFSQGKWETTFNCPEWYQGQNLNCDGLVRGGDWYPGGDRNYGTRIISEANNPAGQGGRGVRFWKGSGQDNSGSGTLGVTFPSPQPELWVRWYERYESGFSWGGTIDVKSLYFRDGGNRNPYLGFYGSNGYRIYNQGSTGPYPVTTTAGGWNTIYTIPLSGRSNVSDGSRHCFEAYLKMDTNGTDGIGRIWLNGNLIAEHTGVNWSGGNTTTRLGWTGFGFLSNQKDPRLDRPYYVDFDDMVIYNQTPPNRDAHGNPFIGPLPLAPPESLSITVEPQ